MSIDEPRGEHAVPPSVGEPYYAASPYPPPGFYAPVPPEAWGGPAGPVAPAPGRRRGRRVLVGTGAAVVAAALVVSGVAIGRASAPPSANTAGSGQAAQDLPGTSTGSGSGSGSGSWPGLPGSGTGSGNGSGSGSGTGSSTDGSLSGTTAATAAQTKGIVTIVSTLGYQSAQAAGTGMILSSDGEILTNNHVIDGATSITVTDESTDRSYTATVVGDDPTHDIAVLKLSNASGLSVAKTATASQVDAAVVGTGVIGVGNAAGTGALRGSAGTITALDQSITASDDSGQNAEQLTGLIETNANIISGDSGGPLYTSSGTVIGMDTAGESGRSATTGAAQVATTAYAIPIDTAMQIAAQIESGQASSTVHIGAPAFLGVSVTATSTGGVGVGAVVSGGPASSAGIVAGDVITSVGGHAVANPTALGTVLAGYRPGERVAVTWTDTTGQTRSATVVLATGAAD